MRKLLIPLVLLQIVLVSCKTKAAIELYELFHFDTPGWAHAVALDGPRIYIAGRQGGLAVFDRFDSYKRTLFAPPIRDVISMSPNSGTPVLAASFEGLVLLSPDGRIIDRYANGAIINSVEVRDDLVFAAGGSRGLMVAELEQGSFCKIADLPTKGWSHSIRLSGNQALLADWTYGLRIVDIRDPRKLAEIASLQSPATCISIAVRGSGNQRMLALAEGNAGIALVQLDPSGHPTLLGRNYLGLNPRDPVHPETGGWAHSVAWAGRYLFVANWKRGLVVLDAQDPANPRVIRELPLPGTALGIYAQSQPDDSYLVFLADGESGLRVFRFRY